MSSLSTVWKHVSMYATPFSRKPSQLCSINLPLISITLQETHIRSFYTELLAEFVCDFSLLHLLHTFASTFIGFQVQYMYLYLKIYPIIERLLSWCSWNSWWSMCRTPQKNIEIPNEPCRHREKSRIFITKIWLLPWARKNLNPCCFSHCECSRKCWWAYKRTP